MSDVKAPSELGTRDVKSLLWKFSLPAIVAMLVGVLYNVVDRIFIGHVVGADGIAGISISTPLWFIIMSFAMLIGIGGNALFSIKLGEHKLDEAKKILGNSITLFIIISGIITLISIVFIDKILLTIGVSEKIMPYAHDYAFIILLGTIFQMLSLGVNNFIRAAGHPKKAMITMIIGAALNIILDYFMVVKWNMGMKGAAWATVISMMVSTVFVLYHFYAPHAHIKPRRDDLKLHFSLVEKIVLMGMPTFLAHISLSVYNFVLNTSLLRYGGDMAISTIGIIQSVMNFVYMPLFGVVQGQQPVVGYNYGAHKYNRVRQTYKYALNAVTIFLLIMTLVVQVFARQMVMIFNNSNEALIEMSTYALRLSNIFMVFIGQAILGGTFLRDVGQSKTSTALILSRILVMLIIPLLILPRFYGLDGVWLSLGFSDLGGGVVSFIFIRRFFKKLKIKEKELAKVTA
jgi:putative MATE family efflux protein